MRRYPTESIINCRDLGGWPCPGGATAAHRAIRCGIPLPPTAQDRALLRQLGVRAIVDLRGQGEALANPSAFAADPAFDYYHISLYEANPATAADGRPLTALYREILTTSGAGFAAVLRLLPTLPQPFLFHCFCGKDRTGLLSALLLAAAGVDAQDIIADYEVSYTYIKPFFEREIAAGSPLIWQTDLEKLRTDAAVMEETLTFLQTAYGGARGYLAAVGLTAQEIAAVETLLAPE